METRFMFMKIKWPMGLSFNGRKLLGVSGQKIFVNGIKMASGVVCLCSGDIP